MYNFVDELEFDRLGVFTYSGRKERRCRAGGKPGAQEIKEGLQAGSGASAGNRFLKGGEHGGRCLPVPWLSKVDGRECLWRGTYKDAPDVDGLLFINTSRDLMTGDFCECAYYGS